MVLFNEVLGNVFSYTVQLRLDYM